MANRKKDRVGLEELTRNPRPSRQSKTRSGRPLIPVSVSLLELRQRVGMSQTQLAHAAGVPIAAIANVEAERYALSARSGVDLFLAIMRTASPQSAEYRDAKQAALELIAGQKELWRKSKIAIAGQLESLKKKSKQIKSAEAELDAKESRLREV
jgi:transcriptional regulator with XRE-family HTH domain